MCLVENLRKTQTNLVIYGIIMCVAFIGYVIFLYYDFATWVKSGEEKRINIILYQTYKLGSKL